MCTILFSFNKSDQYPLIVAANRDEFLDRESAAVHWWKDEDGQDVFLAGKDKKAGGTWMGLSQNGRLAILTNVRAPEYFKPGQISRGILPVKWLQDNIPEEKFKYDLEQTNPEYAGYNLIYGDLSKLNFHSNHNNQHFEIQPGIHGLSNGTLDSPWPKVVRGKRHLEEMDTKKGVEAIVNDLLQLMSDRSLAAESDLPSTGIDREWERKLSALNIRMTNYGTKVTTVYVLDRMGQGSVMEYNHLTGSKVEIDVKIR